ncbi:MAG TPA: hypothetical protein VG826_15965 [Pirellulales bacterium]|nr:hypothetical protein [Pirellulales bacterium]
MPDQIPNNSTRSVINWLRTGGDEAKYWTEEAQRVWERSAEGDPATRLERARETLAQYLENDVVDGSLLNHAAARVAA